MNNETLIPKEPASDAYLTKRELASRLHKSPRTVEIWTRKGILPVIKISHSVLYPWGEVRSALNRFCLKGNSR